MKIILEELIKPIKISLDFYKIDKMTEIEERINQSISTVINDNLISESTTYSSSKLEDMFCTIFQSSTEEPVNQGIGGLWFCEE